MSQNLIKLENVYFFYTKIAEPQKDAFDTTGTQKKFGITVALTKAEAKEFKKLKLNKTVKEISGEEFLAKYKTIPDELKNDDDEYFLISLTAKATYPDGNPTPEWTHPKTYLWNESTQKPEEATKTLVGNGSFGDVRMSTKEANTGQINVSLHSILVRNLVPYETRGDEWASQADGTSGSQGSEEDTPPF